ncbi:DUF4281 domain-containing protein [Cephalotus follicularis]|uniref:DUF4281 domain-containing protein n=1 Tax=Cephalotus follicularis TaxID=3775 RepID=A0A1Q3DAT5_CEPFO|nr:DUF4281 domain-containing protein [Cephalotus follicularis]
MASFSSCFCHPQLLLKIDNLGRAIGPQHNVGVHRRSTFAFKSMSSGIFGLQVARMGTDYQIDWSFTGGSRIIIRPKAATVMGCRKCPGIHASWLSNSQIAHSVFGLGTVAVLPFYTLMVFAPKAELTKKSMGSGIPYVVLGLLYAYLLYLSWTPDTLGLMFTNKYWLPELPGIAKMFSSEMTLASAWIHLLAVDLYAARQVFQDGLENQVETRHSVSLCLLSCPVGIMAHVVTKALTKRAGSNKNGMH